MGSSSAEDCAESTQEGTQVKRFLTSVRGLLCRLRGYHRDCGGIGYAEDGVYVIGVLWFPHA